MSTHMATSSISVPVGTPVSNPNTNTNVPTLAPMTGGSPNGSHETLSLLPQQSMPPSFNATSVAPSASTPSAARSVKRPRPVKSCTECRKRKLKCDRNLPCSQCQKSQRTCRYAADQDSSALSDASDAEPSDVQSGRPAKRNCLTAVHGSSFSASHLDPLLSASSRNGDLAAGGGALSPFEELASRVDRLEQLVLAKSPGTTDHVSTGVSVPRPPLPLSSETIRGLTVKGEDLRTRFFGQSSVRVLVNLFHDAKHFLAHESGHDEFRGLMHNLLRLHRVILEDYKKSLKPNPVYVDSVTPIRNRMKHILPPRPVCDRLLGSYIHTTETIYRIIHIPTFMADYERFWDNKLEADNFLPLLLAILSTGSRFESKSKGLGLGADGLHIPTACELVRSWLSSLKGKHLIEFTTLQTEVLLLHAQRMTTPRPHVLWTQLGSVVRMAMTMGLHRDPSEFDGQIRVFWGELRRRLWYSILELDLHISLMCNLPCLIREGDHTCQAPRNIDDGDLYVDMTELPPGRPMDHSTDNQIQSYAAMTLPTRMKIIHVVNRIDSVRDCNEVLELGAKMERFAEDIGYLFPRTSSLSDSDKSKQWRCRVILDMHVRRPLLALYRPFALGVPDAPPQLTRSYLASSMVILQYLDELDPRLAHYENVSDMYHQVLKKDMLQASLSLCWYIRVGLEAGANGAGAGAGAGAGGGVKGEGGGGGGGGGNTTASETRLFSPDSTEGAGTFPGSLALWSPSRLIRTVEKSMELLMHNVGGSDVKDLVALAVVFATVKTSMPEQRRREIRRMLTVVLETCMRATNTNPQLVMAAPGAGVGVGPGSGSGSGSGPVPASALAGDPMHPYAAAGPGPPPSHFPYPPGAVPADVREADDTWRLWEGWD
ncbi:hypothetical protein SODALDRAFT_218752 [Sodiomyces alkalinus F11]|uniref:Zn(2)-C6 fungal-type domain-containing protein n=1 Tax=Sodiomyces alkalinus (strain CBS 110278 / VKM F-3762 / F11) TaxID=1314773 RepID=A0A3N2PPF9_SODAK|nr:hypothetical protein SODALDRAFT_218752 [Sodiomyces alkalinus F11]ROT36397.1 hypothetical protein SODALDRAFT_218752 [Sodiomyces alkalinus F11]